jgi:hypothetical protein
MPAANASPPSSPAITATADTPPSTTSHTESAKGLNDCGAMPVFRQGGGSTAAHALPWRGGWRPRRIPRSRHPIVQGSPGFGITRSTRRSRPKSKRNDTGPKITGISGPPAPGIGAFVRRSKVGRSPRGKWTSLPRRATISGRVTISHGHEGEGLLRKTSPGAGNRGISRPTRMLSAGFNHQLEKQAHGHSRTMGPSAARGCCGNRGFRSYRDTDPTVRPPSTAWRTPANPNPRESARIRPGIKRSPDEFLRTHPPHRR